MNLIVTDPHTALWRGERLRCATGRAGIVAADAKREGDGATPIGLWPLRRGFYRPDRIERPDTPLPMQPMTPADAWCDVPGDPLYNRHVRLPYPSVDEKLWRDDHAYDIVCMLGYNDDPVGDGKGSAIFLHLARQDYAPTAGCVALALPDLLTVLAGADVTASVEVRG